MAECCCLAHSFQVAATRCPNEVCVIQARAHDSVTDVSFTFAELWNWINAFSELIQGYLQNAAAQDNSSSVPRVGVMVPPSAEYIVALLAVNKLSAAFVPLDPQWPVSRIIASAEDSGISLLIGCAQTSWMPPHYEQQFQEVSKAVSCQRVLVHRCMASSERPWTCYQPSFSYILYTSGSTGRPKGVCGTQRGLLNRIQWMQDAYPYLASDVSCFKTAVSFVDHLTEILGPLLAGCRLVIPFGQDIQHNPLGLFKYLQVYQVTRLVAVPSLLQTLLPAVTKTSSLTKLRIIVCSGELLLHSLVQRLQQALPNASILNLYGSTEVSGDCSYFDCSEPLKMTDRKHVPVGKPIANCSMHILSETDSGTGELYVGGVGVACGYWKDTMRTNQSFVTVPGIEGGRLFKTGDLVRRLDNGNYLLVGRTDRLLQVRGHRVEPEEVERSLGDHPEVVRAAVHLHRCLNDDTQLAACVILVEQAQHDDLLQANVLKVWLKNRLPAYMIPERFVFVKELPMTSSGKIDYSALSKMNTASSMTIPTEVENSELAERIVKVFCDVLLVENLSPSDDFFLLGGTSVTAAHAAHLLGIDMRLLMKHRSALQLCDAMRSLDKLPLDTNSLQATNKRKRTERREAIEDCSCKKKRKTDVSVLSSKWLYQDTLSGPAAFVRGNQNRSENNGKLRQLTLYSDTWTLRSCWKNCLHACVDASTLLIATPSKCRLYLGSHAHKFFCIDAISGETEWETLLGGRVESTAAVTRDNSVIVVGCYDGSIYFLDPNDGKVTWSYRTDGEVKCQPAVDTWMGFVWCGSHDHCLYVLDHVSRTCIWKHLCNGSIFGSPCLDSAKKQAYVATTSGHVYLFHTQPTYGVSWELTLNAPIFASPSFSSSIGHVVFAAVDGSVTALATDGRVIWKVKTGGPVFSGPCLSDSSKRQILVCSRDGYVYSYCLVSGKLLWKFYLNEPLVAGAWVDDSVQLHNRNGNSCYRFLCACTTSGTVYVLKFLANVDNDGVDEGTVCSLVTKFQLPGDVFSTPLMLGTRVFLGCRDNHVYCLDLVHSSS